MSTTAPTTAPKVKKPIGNKTRKRSAPPSTYLSEPSTSGGEGVGVGGGYPPPASGPTNGDSSISENAEQAGAEEGKGKEILGLELDDLGLDLKGGDALASVDPEQLFSLRDKLGSMLKDCESNNARVAALYSITDEAASMLGLSDYSNQLIVIGMQSSGKTSLFEALLHLPLGFTGQGSATMCAVVYRLRYNQECDAPRCSITWQNTRRSNLSITELNTELHRIMASLTEIDLVNQVQITIEDRQVMTLTLIDLPGLIAPEEITDNNRVIRKRDIETLLKKYVGQPSAVNAPRKNAGGGGPVQRILWVKSAVEDQSRDVLQTSFLREVDPSLQRTIVAATKTDLLRGTVRNTPDQLEELMEQSWPDKPNEALQPWFIGLHGIPTEVKKSQNWEAIRSLIKQQLEGNERDQIDFLKASSCGGHLANAQTYANKWGWTPFRKHLQNQINKDFLKNAEMLFTKLLQVATRLEHESKTLKESVDLSLANRSGCEVVNEFISQFKSQLMLMLDHGAFETEFLNQYGKTMEEEHAAASEFISRHGVIPWPNSSTDYLRQVANADRKAVTYARTHRVNAELIKRISAITPTTFTADQLLNAIHGATQIDLMNPPEAVADLLHRALTRDLENIIPYAVWRMAFCLLDSFEPTIALMSERAELRVGAENAEFITALKQAYEEWVIKRAKKCEQVLRIYASAFWGYQSWNLPEYLSHAIAHHSDDALEGQAETGGILGTIRNVVVSETGNAAEQDVRTKKGGLMISKDGTRNVADLDTVNQVEAKMRSQFDAHKVLMSIILKHIVTSEIMRAADPRKEIITPAKLRLEPFLKERLTSKAALATASTAEDPFGICESTKRAQDTSQRKARQAEGIRDLHRSLVRELQKLGETSEVYTLLRT